MWRKSSQWMNIRIFKWNEITCFFFVFFVERLNVLYERNWTMLVHEQLRRFESSIIKAAKSGFIEKIADGLPKWSFNEALLYSVTLITTIGEYLFVAHQFFRNSFSSSTKLSLIFRSWKSDASNNGRKNNDNGLCIVWCAIDANVFIELRKIFGQNITICLLEIE